MTQFGCGSEFAVSVDIDWTLRITSPDIGVVIEGATVVLGNIDIMTFIATDVIPIADAFPLCFSC